MRLTALLLALALHTGAMSPSVPRALALPVANAATSTAAKTQPQDAYGKLPLSFEENRGQADAQVRFISRGSGYTLYLTPTGAVLSLSGAASTPSAAGADTRITGGAVLRMALVGADPKVVVAGADELPGKANYLLGNDPNRWRTDVPTYAKVNAQGIYPGIDMVYYGNQRQLEYDFIVAPGADPNAVRLQFEGAERLELDASGDLVLHTRGGEVRQRKPFVYQVVDGTKKEIASRYKLGTSGVVSFVLGEYDRTRPLIIDPVLSYSTYLGGDDADRVSGIAVDSAGNAYVSGDTTSTDFPTSRRSLDRECGTDGRCNREPEQLSADAFVTKLDPTGSTLLYSTYLGGGNAEYDVDIALDPLGNAYVMGRTDSMDFPSTSGAFDRTCGTDGKCNPDNIGYGRGDTFVTKLDLTGSKLLYSTYLGGSGGDDQIGGIAVDQAGNAYVTGATYSDDFPTTRGAFDHTCGATGRCGADHTSAFITKLNTTGSKLSYSTYLGGDSTTYTNDIAVDAAGHAHVTGYTDSSAFPTTPGAYDHANRTQANSGDAFVTKFNATGTKLAYSTYLGGGDTDIGIGIAVDAAGAAYVTGGTASDDFPTTEDAFDHTFSAGNCPRPLAPCDDRFVTKLNASGSELLYSTYLGGRGYELGGDQSTGAIAVDSSGNAYVTGDTFSDDFPTTPGTFDRIYGGNGYLVGDAFVTALNATGSRLLYSTYLGGKYADAGKGIAVESAKENQQVTDIGVYVAGSTGSSDFPTTLGAFDRRLDSPEPALWEGDAFVTKLVLGAGDQRGGWDDQQGEMPGEVPDTGAGGLAAGTTIPVGNATAGLTMLAAAGYALLRRR